MSSLRTEAFAEAQASGVEGSKQLFNGGAGLRGDVPDACTVKVHLEAVIVDKVRNANDLGLGDYRAIESVLNLDDLRWGAAAALK